MKNLIIFLCLNSIFIHQINAQCSGSINLIPNPSFEIYGACPTYSCGFPQELRSSQTMCTSWFGIENSCPVGGTPDYCRASTETLPTCSSQLTAFSGNGMCLEGTHCLGYFTFAGGTNTREYVQCQLTTQLTAGTTYCFSGVVKSRAGGAGNELCNTNGFGAYFHNLGIIDIDAQNGGLQFLGAGSVVNGAPQIQASGNIPHNACTTISGTFVATGTENFLTIGNFRNDASTTKSTSGTSSYIYVDDLQLYEIITLPIELINFDGRCENNLITLNWSTASERNNDFFTIEQTCDGVNFEKVAEIDGAGDSQSPLNYTTTISRDCPGYSYFRLSQTDFDGKMETFHMISIDCSDDSEILIYPNPVNNELTIHVGENSVERIELFDAAGRLVITRNYFEGVSNANISLDLSGVNNGVYWVRFEIGQMNHILKKIIKL